MHDIYYTKRNSVNAYMYHPPRFCTVQYETLGTVTTYILACCRGTIRTLINVFQWELSSPANCLKGSASLSNGLCNPIRQFDIIMSHILDDIIMIWSPNSISCQKVLDSFHLLARSMKIPLKHSHAPTICIEVHGLEVDTIALEFTRFNKKHQLLNQASREMQTDTLGPMVPYLVLSGLAGPKDWIRMTVQGFNGHKVPTVSSVNYNGIRQRGKIKFKIVPWTCVHFNHVQAIESHQQGPISGTQGLLGMTSAQSPMYTAQPAATHKQHAPH